MYRHQTWILMLNLLQLSVEIIFGVPFTARSSLIGCTIRSVLNGSFPELERSIIIDFLNHQSKLQVLFVRNGPLHFHLNNQNIETLHDIIIPPGRSRYKSHFSWTLHLEHNYLRNLRGLQCMVGPTSINLSNNRICEFLSFHLVAPRHHPFAHLLHLILDGNHITSDLLQKYFDFWSFPMLETLSLRNNSITTLHDVTFPVLQALDLSHNLISNLTNFNVIVRDLEISNNKLTSEILRTFSMTNCDIHTLRLMNNEIDDFSEIVFPKTLKILSLDRNPIRKCIQIQHSMSLEQFYLRNAGLTENGLKALIPPGSLRELTILDLTQNEIQSIDAIHFPPNLRCLFLGRNKIRNLRDTAFPERLTHLYLGDNLLMNNHKNRMKIRFPKRLIHLELQHNAIHSLCGVELPEYLTHLCLDYNEITDLMLYKMQFKIPQTLSLLSLRMNQLSRLFSLRVATRVRADRLCLDGNSFKFGKGCACRESKEKEKTMKPRTLSDLPMPDMNVLTSLPPISSMFY